MNPCNNLLGSNLNLNIKAMDNFLILESCSVHTLSDLSLKFVFLGPVT